MLSKLDILIPCGYNEGVDGKKKSAYQADQRDTLSSLPRRTLRRLGGCRGSDTRCPNGCEKIGIKKAPRSAFRK